MNKVLNCVGLIAGFLMLGLYGQEVAAEAGEPSVQVLLTEVVASGDASREEIDNLYRRAILEYGGVDEVAGALSKAAADENLPNGKRANAHLVGSNLYWRNGRMDMALEAADRALGVIETGEALLQKARLLDASGSDEQARSWYERALRALKGSRQEENIRLRLTMMQVDDESAKALVDLALQRDQAFRNRAALALAALGYHKDAILLFKVEGKGKRRFREYIRVTEWALRAEDARMAQEQAWVAISATTDERDRLYALSLLVEAYRLDGGLDRLIERFDAAKELSPEARQIWIDLLRERGRYEDALALFKESGSSRFTARERRQLITMYGEAGRDEAVVDEFRQLIAQEPGEVNWYAGLSEHFLGEGNSAAAEKLWRDFLKVNRGDLAVLLTGADAMTRTGFDALAAQGLENNLAGDAGDAPVLFTLFDIHKEQGRNKEAGNALARLDKLLPATASERVDLADSYERLGQPDQALAIWDRLAQDSGELAYDEAVRLAWLYGSLGKKDEALEIWRSLWGKVKLPARRSFVEHQIIKIATEIGSMGDIAVDLEEKLMAGTASRNDSSLLVRIYTNIGDDISAVEVIDEYFAGNGEAEVESLAGKADIYLLLRDSKNYRKTIRRLIEIDPGNRAEYLQGLILEQIEGVKTEESQESLQTRLLGLLQEMRDIDAEAVGGEFEGGVLAHAGLLGQAIKAYRNAIARYPERTDIYLLLGDLLQEEGRREEAVAMFQYLAEWAEQSDIFVTAIDGILNVNTGQGQGMVAVGGAGASLREPGKNGVEKSIKWARRIILERLAADADKIYLYELLADVADDLGDKATRFSAVESTLALAEGRRSAVLRRLITMIQAPGGSMSGISGNSARASAAVNGRHIAYGRRLVALNEEFPPDIYIGLGEAFLKLKDPVSAAKAFNMARDMTGRLNIRKKAAELFAKAGYNRQALDQYIKALIADRGSITTMLELGNIRSKLGQDGAANGLYAAAIDVLMRRQPAILDLSQMANSRPAGLPGLTVHNDPSVTREFTMKYGELLQGYLLTWPREPSLIRQRLALLEEMLGDELARVAAAGLGDQQGAFQARSRLNRISLFVRRVALAAGQPDFANRMDVRLLAHFSHDSEFVTSLIDQRVEWGYFAAAENLAGQVEGIEGGAGEKIKALLALDPAGRLPGVEEVLQKTDPSYGFALNIGLMNQSQSQIMAAAREWAKSGQYGAAMEWAKGRLEPRNFTNFCGQIAALLRRNKHQIMSMFGPYIDLVIEIEEVTGKPVFSETDIMAALNSGKYSGLYLMGGKYFSRRLSPRRNLEIVERLLENAENPAMMMLNIVGQFWKDMLREPLEPDVADRVADLMLAAVARLPVAMENMAGAFGESPAATNTRALAVAEVHERNIGLARKIVDAWRERAGQEIDFYQPVLLISAGKTEQALDAFLAAGLEFAKQPPEVEDKFDSPMFLADFFLEKHEAEMRGRLDAMEARVGSSPELTNLRFELFFAGGDADQVGLESFLTRANELHPDNPEYLLRLANLYLEQGRLRASAGAHERLFQLDPENIVYRAALFEIWKKLDAPQRALALNDDSPEDMLAAGFLDKVRQIQQSQQPEGGFGGFGPSMGGASAFGMMSIPVGVGSGGHSLRILAAPAPQIPRGNYNPMGFDGDRMAEMVSANDSDAVRTELRALWQRAETKFTPGIMMSRPPISYESIFGASIFASDKGVAPGAGAGESLFPLAGETAAAPRATKLFDAVTGLGFSVDEFENYARSMDIDEGESRTKLYAYMVKAYRRHGVAAEKRAALMRALSDGSAGFQQFSLWLTLLAAGEDVPTAADHEIIDGWFARNSRLSPYQLTYMARIYARSGEMQQAVAAYRLLAARALKSTFPVNMTGSFSFNNSGETPVPFMTAWKLVDQINLYLDGENRVAVLEDILRLTRRGEGTESEQLQQYRLFALLALGKVLDADAALAKVAEHVGQPGADWDAGGLMEFAALQARTGKVVSALQTLNLLAQTGAPQAVPSHGFMGGGRLGTPAGESALKYPRMLGLPAGVAAAGDMLALTGNLFPQPENHWPGTRQWLQRSAAALDSWIGEKGMDGDKALRLMSLIAYRLHEAGDGAAAAKVIGKISAQIAKGEYFAQQTILAAISVADSVGQALDPEAMRELLRAGRLDGEQAAELVRRTAISRGAADALELGERAAEYTRSDALLAALIAVAEEAGDDARAEHWRKARKDAAEARQKLLPEAA
jgi:predicted Zn-dependent protease